jgi:diphthamide synthase (EF-2-diphthine--ammonia ligase)
LWALHVLQQSGQAEVAGLLTTVTKPYQRVTMHAVRERLLEAQAEALGLPLHEAFIPSPCSNEQYEAVMGGAIEEAKRAGVSRMVFGDLFLADIRAYRERQLAGAGMEACFPLWGEDTGRLAREMIAGGVRAYITCLDPGKLGRDFAGASYDLAFLESLPEEADPCGENGEFHTFAWDGPGFARPLAVRLGETVERDGFVFTDVLPRAEGDEG